MERILLESACGVLSQESESTPFNPWVVAVLNYLAVGKVSLEYLRRFGDQQTARYFPCRSVQTILHLSTGYCSCKTSYAYCSFESV